MGAFGKIEIGGGIFEQHAPLQHRLDQIDMLDDPRQRLIRIGQRQQVVVKSRLVARPGEMLGKAFRLVARADHAHPLQMLAVEGLAPADGEADAVDRQGVIGTQPGELRVRDAARPI